MALHRDGTNGPPVSTPVPDPTVLTTHAIETAVAGLRDVVDVKIQAGREVIETRLAALDTATELLQRIADTLPQRIKDEVAHLRELREEAFHSLMQNLETRFVGVQTQFIERDKRTEQLSVADKTAIAAALQAQKEAAAAINESNTVAINKMETNFAKLIEQGQQLLQTVSLNTDEKINDLKGRIDRGEGKTSISDPAVANGMAQMMAMMQDLAKSRDASKGSSEGVHAMVGYVVGVGGFLVALGVLLLHMHG
jgi:septation ring formation regulator EzrA